MSFKEKGLNLDLMQTEKDKQYILPDDDKKIDYSKFRFDNWFLAKSEKNKILADIRKKGGGLWLSHDGSICFRVSVDANVIVSGEVEKASRAIAAFLERVSPVVLFKEPRGNNKKIDIYVNELMYAADKFTPFSNSEFYKENGVWYRTGFVPSEYLRGAYKKAVGEPVTIIKLIKNLTNNNEVYFQWTINWLAGFFQTLKKSQVSLVLRGDQGAGKGIFFEKIITPLFGEKYCKPVDNDNLESNFKPWVEGSLFLNLNEIANDLKSRKNVKNFVKQLVTEKHVNVETKFKDADLKRVFANILITSNESFPIEVEPGDRRFTIFQTGKSLKSKNWNIEETLKDIDAELPAFAEYLKNYEVDFLMYNRALETPEKQAIIEGTTSQIKLYIVAVIDRNILFFSDLLESEDEEENELYRKLKDSFEVTGRITNKLLYESYKALFESKKSMKQFLRELRRLAPEVFGEDKIKRSNGERFYSPWEA